MRIQKLVLAFLLAALLAACAPAALADSDYVTLDTELSVFDDTGYGPDTCELFFTIAENAPANVEIDIADGVFQVAPQGYIVMPGDKLMITVHVFNNGKLPYRYKDQSFMISSGDHEGEYLTEFVGADGKKLPLSHISAISPSIKAIQALVGKSTSKIEAEDIFSIYETLAAKGYTGETALCDFMLDYYNDAFSTHFATFSDLISSDKRRDIGKLFADSGSDSLFELTMKEVENLCAAHPEMDPYVMLFSTSDPDMYYVQIKWPEEALAAYSYDFFHEDLFAAAYGDEALSMNAIQGVDFTRERGIFDYVDPEKEAYPIANNYFKTIFAELPVGAEGTFEMAMTLDGPWVGNGYASYDMSFTNTIELERVGSLPSTGDDANLMLWSIMALLSGAVIVLAMRKKNVNA